MEKRLNPKNALDTLRDMKTYPPAQSLGFFDGERRGPWLAADANSKLLERYAVTDASGHDSQKLAELVEPTDGAVSADRAYRSAEAEAMLAQKRVASPIHERAYRNRPVSDEQKETNRPKSKLRARSEHVFGFMRQSLKGFYLRSLGRRRNAAAIGLINLSDNRARDEPRPRRSGRPAA